VTTNTITLRIIFTRFHVDVHEKNIYSFTSGRPSLRIVVLATFAWWRHHQQVPVSRDVVRCGEDAEQTIRPDTWVHWSPCWRPSSCRTPVDRHYLTHTARRHF